MPSWSTTIPTVRTLALMASLLWYHRCPTSGGSAARQSRESSLNYPVSQPTQRGEAFGRTRHQRPTNRDQGNWKSRCWRQQQPHERPLHPACVAESVNIPAEVLVTLMATSSPLGTWEEGTQLEHGVSCRASAAVDNRCLSTCKRSRRTCCSAARTQDGPFLSTSISKFRRPAWTGSRRRDIQKKLFRRPTSWRGVSWRVLQT